MPPVYHISEGSIPTPSLSNLGVYKTGTKPELLCGVAFITGYFVPLASILIAPITVNIFLFHVFVDLVGLPVAIFLVLANVFMAYVN
jgi:hypothetical protein